MKVGDFGITKRVNNSLSNSVRYSDPECLIYHEYTSNVYNVGMLLWEISSGRIPFESEPADGKLISSIIHGKREMIVNGTPQKYSEIYTGMSI